MFKRWAEEKKREAVAREMIGAPTEHEQSSSEWNWKRKVGDESGSEERFHERIKVYDARRTPRVSHHFWWFVHNCVAHPLIGMAPLKFAFDFHDWTSKKINGVE